MFNFYVYLLLLFTPFLQLSANQEEQKTLPPKYFAQEIKDQPPYEEDHFWSELMNMFITLGFIIALLIGLAWIMRKMQTSRIQYTNESSLLKIVDHRSLSSKSSLYLIHVHDRAIVLADTQSGTTALADFPIENESKNTKESPVPDFAKHMEG